MAYPQVEIFDAANSAWRRADVIGVGNGTALVPVEIVVTEMPTPLLAYNFNAGSGATVYDRSGNGRDLPVDGLRWAADGHTGPGLRDVLNQPSEKRSSAGLATLERTMMFWAKIGVEASGEYCHAVHFENTDASSVWAIGTQDPIGRVWFRAIKSDGSLFNINNVPKKPVGEWHHYAMTTNGRTLRCYIDGAVVWEDTAWNSEIMADNGDMQLYGAGNNQQVIDDLRLYDVALSPAQIIKAMNTPVAD